MGQKKPTRAKMKSKKKKFRPPKKDELIICDNIIYLSGSAIEKITGLFNSTKNTK